MKKTIVNQTYRFSFMEDGDYYTLVDVEELAT